MDNLIRKTKYSLLSLLTLLVYFIGYLGFKLTIVSVGIGIAFLLEEHIGKLGLTFGWIIGTIAGGLFLLLLRYIAPHIERIDDKAKTYKRFRYTERYGSHYPEPKAEDFGITKDEFTNYNGRFQFEFIRIILVFTPCVAALIYLFQKNRTFHETVLSLGGAVFVAVLIDHFFKTWNKRISQRHPYYEKINKFQEAVHIYHQIQKEKIGF